MLEVKSFQFNPFGVNTYVLWDESLSGILIDSGNSTNEENQRLLSFIENKGIKIEGLYLTHLHIDHILGAHFLSRHFGVPVRAHRAGNFLFDKANEYAQSLGFSHDKNPDNVEYIDENHRIAFGNIIGQVLYTPGHVDGSLCFYFDSAAVLFSGDVLFRQGVGRTDLETGDYHILENSIRQKLFRLPDDTMVFPGHGPSTSIRFEKRYNPFFSE
ncbi:MAG: MBL fold metallo-hydrolase [Bacteroidales bacterium]|nr:MBL fold metallo-hydrolase [Bacteroidales bacterium]